MRRSGGACCRLAGPTTAVMAVQVLVAVSEAWFVAQVGIDALAGIALVIPFITLMMNMANGGMGGGVASALARALGAGRRDDAKALVLHALVLAAAMALVVRRCSPGRRCRRSSAGWAAAATSCIRRSPSARVWFSGAIVLWIQRLPLGAAARRRQFGHAEPHRLRDVAGLHPAAGRADARHRRLARPRPGRLRDRAADHRRSSASILLARAIARGRLGFVPSAHGRAPAAAAVRRDPAGRRDGLGHAPSPRR